MNENKWVRVKEIMGQAIYLGWAMLASVEVVKKARGNQTKT